MTQLNHLDYDDDNTCRCGESLSDLDADLGKIACPECACNLCEGWGGFRVSIDEDAPCPECDGTGYHTR